MSNVCESDCVCKLGFGVCVVKMKDYSIAFIGTKLISQLHYFTYTLLLTDQIKCV